MPELIDEMFALAQLHFVTLSVALMIEAEDVKNACLLYTSPSPRDS